MSPSAAGGGPPLTPDDDTARRWLVQELSKPEYASARPNWFDELSQRVSDWFDSLHLGGTGGSGGWLAVAGGALVLAIVVFAVLRFGLPRLNRRSRAARLRGEVADTRTAEQLRAAADRAAAQGDFSLAVLERFRAIAASLAERTVVAVRPGTTAHEVALAAAAVFPGDAAGLRDAADTFDAARYLGRAQDRGSHERLRELDERLRRTAPAFAAVAR
ncbi:DUF4129 domain-containing protein [Gryllotalpicola protaetiae]|uniref:DUF4129 domain-containing protein n=1 Tax=Gryllotalpicola protaetiae TaxID=2419771 RepID=UPI0013C485B0|nr:DUF4129 domain-containing protein [Gryllotalpicola protaetiae]